MKLKKKNMYVSDKNFIDLWCARNVRKVQSCEECLHYQECLEAGHSLAPRAEERLLKQKNQKPVDPELGKSIYEELREQFRKEQLGEEPDEDVG